MSGEVLTNAQMAAADNCCSQSGIGLSACGLDTTISASGGTDSFSKAAVALAGTAWVWARSVSLATTLALASDVKRTMRQGPILP